MPEDRIRDESTQREEERPRRARREEEEDERPRRRARSRDEEDERPRRRIRRDDDEDVTGGLIPYKNPQALISYYLGVFSLIPGIGILLGIASIVLGILGLKYRGTHPTAGGTAHAWVGIVLGTLVLLAHIALVVFIVVIANAK